jgi:iron complex transport system ATP-binding protein
MASHFPDHAYLSAGKAGIFKNRLMVALGDPDKVLSEKVLEETYGIRIKIVRIGGEINRKICVPILAKALP